MSDFNYTVKFLEERIPISITDNDVVGFSIVLIRDREIAWNKGFGFT